MRICILACLIVAVTSTSCSRLDELLPPQIKDLKMGSSSAQVIDKIGSVGTHSKEVDPKDQTMKITWQATNSPYYQNLIFGFTEKDRLYVIRFSLRPELRHDFQHLKTAFFDKFRISSDVPMKMRVKGQEMLTYISEEGGNYTFFEFTDIRTGEKWFELFDRAIRAKDKPTRSEEEKKENKTDPDKK